MSGESKFAIADMYFRAKKYDEALSDYGKISKDFKGTGFAELADIYTPIAYTKMGDTTKAISAFEKFIKVHPNSEDTAYAKIQIGKLKGTAPQSD